MRQLNFNSKEDRKYRATYFLNQSILLIPGFLLFLIFFIFPIAVLFENSFHDYSRISGVIPGFTFKNYVKILSDSYYLEICLRTIKLALMTSVTTLLIGYPVALYLVSTSPRKRAWIILFILSPLLVSVIVRTFGWLILLGTNGLFDNLGKLFGLQLGSMLHTQTAVIVGLANVLLPFMVLSITTSLQTIDPSVVKAATSLGANPWRVFTKVILPLSLPGIFSGILIVFSLASSSFVTPALLGGSNFKVLSSVIYEQAMVLQNWPFAASFSVTLMVIVVGILALQHKAIEGGKYKVVFH